MRHLSLGLFRRLWFRFFRLRFCRREFVQGLRHHILFRQLALALFLNDAVPSRLVVLDRGLDALKNDEVVNSNILEPFAPEYFQDLLTFRTDFPEPLQGSIPPLIHC